MSRRRRIGLVREVSLFLPLAVLLLVLVSIISLLAHRSAIDELRLIGPEPGGAFDRELSHQKRVADRLTWVVVGVDVAVVLFVLFYLRHLVTPIETLLERAEGIAPLDREATDDVAFLVAAFERAMVALDDSDPQEPDAREIGALQRALGSSLDSGVLLMDESGGVLALNPVGCDLLALSEPGDRRPPVADYCADYPELVELLIAGLEHEEGISRREAQLVRADGRTIQLGLTHHRLRRDDGTTRGHLALFVDLTEAQQRAEVERTAATLAQLGRMSAGLAHELRNSLAALRGYLKLIERHPEGDSIHDYLGEIRGESDHLQRVLEDFLSFARPEARLETFALDALARRVAADPSLAAVPIELHGDFEEEIRIRADRHLLERALRNLLRNAVAAVEEAASGRPVTLSIERTAEHLLLRVADRGVGLSTESPEALFQPFATTRSDGVGLGLPLAQRIFELHGGELTLVSRSGGGTEAIAQLPVGIIVT